jgi:hypothetical protein
VKIFHYESKIQIAEFKCNYGNFITIEYSSDGKLLGLGSECDEAYIIDAETHNYLYCFEGHKNFVSSIKFDECLNTDEQDQIDADEINNNLNMSVMETNTNEYGSNNNQKVNYFI